MAPCLRPLVSSITLICLACGADTPPGPVEPAERPALTGTAAGGAALSADGSADLVLQRSLGRLARGVDGQALPARLDGRMLAEGETVDWLRMLLPAAGLALGVDYAPETLPPGIVLVQVGPDPAFDPSPWDDVAQADPLCALAPEPPDGSDKACGKSFVTTVLRGDDGSADIHLRVDALDLRPGGRVDLSLRVPRFRQPRGDGSDWFCCGTGAEMRFSAQLDESLGFVGVEASGDAFQGSQTCTWATLEEARLAGTCPALY